MNAARLAEQVKDFYLLTKEQRIGMKYKQGEFWESMGLYKGGCPGNMYMQNSNNKHEQ